jgi:hypothetical protein
LRIQPLATSSPWRESFGDTTSVPRRSTQRTSTTCIPHHRALIPSCCTPDPSRTSNIPALVCRRCGSPWLFRGKELSSGRPRIGPVCRCRAEGSMRCSPASPGSQLGLHRPRSSQSTSMSKAIHSLTQSRAMNPQGQTVEICRPRRFRSDASLTQRFSMCHLWRSQWSCLSAASAMPSATPAPELSLELRCGAVVRGLRPVDLLALMRELSADA